MGMKRKRLAYVKKFGKKFAGWLRTVKPTPAPEPEVKKPKPAPAPVIEENQEEKE